MRRLDKVKAAFARVKKAVEPLQALKGWSGVLGFFKLAPHVVEEVEAAGKDLGLMGADKKQIAVDVILDLIPDAWAPDWLLEPLVNWAIERAVTELQRKNYWQSRKP